MIELENGSYYTGYTTNLENRFNAHRFKKGAKITRSFRPVRMLAAWSTPDRSTALRLEAAIKKLSRQEKTALLTDRAVGRRFGLIGVRRIKVPEVTSF
ncbi:MAG: GIY-YIG nuclease family protein [Leptonema sp. (in: Bacteria)]|nr:GIY-YIG nuclease family protein [Leptonema sp. (in: bacteria)]